ncbi:MAG: hypothetical protein O2843_07045, partial [Chloroflexi bacterium]|nr:hypothetical protein [Chloroflexota bacterium]
GRRRVIAAPFRYVGDALQRLAAATPGWVGPSAFLFVTVIGIGVAIYGAFIADPDIRVSRFDAGPVTHFAIRELRAYPEIDLYVVGLDDGRLRAIDGRVQETGCSVQWRPDDARGSERSPGGVVGAFVDPCGSGVWSMLGDGIVGTNVPLRTPQITYHAGDDGANHAFVEMINHPAFP